VNYAAVRAADVFAYVYRVLYSVMGHSAVSKAVKDRSVLQIRAGIDIKRETFVSPDTYKRGDIDVPSDSDVSYHGAQGADVGRRINFRRAALGRKGRDGIGHDMKGLSWPLISALINAHCSAPVVCLSYIIYKYL
jgi:hypothetical protein